MIIPIFTPIDTRFIVVLAPPPSNSAVFCVGWSNRSEDALVEGKKTNPETTVVRLPRSGTLVWLKGEIKNTRNACLMQSDCLFLIFLLFLF